ncbi:MAG: hypothetical protein QGF53_14480, partial [Alphaproteobacteria bacterium]|nr:hypothetical protein [Alphaproteobacteria bacterium]
MASNQLTVLTARSPATKTHSRRSNGDWHTAGFSLGTLFAWREEPTGDIYDVARIIAQLKPEELIIRGRIHEDKRGSHRLRRKLANFGGTAAGGGTTACEWAMIDLDGVEVPDHFDIATEGEDMCEWLIGEYLPEPFHDVACFWQFSSSAGIKPGVSVHLFFWLDRAITGSDMKVYLKAHAPHVDLSLFRDVQPHYVAAPIFADGCVDPIQKRAGLMDREHDHATIPAIDRPALIEHARAHGGAAIVVEGFQENLALIGDQLRGSGFHQPIRNAIMWAVRETLGRAPLDAEQIKAQVREAIVAATKRPGRDVSDYLSDRYLDASIEGAVRRRQTEIIPARQESEAVGGETLADAARIVTDAVAEFMREAATADEPVAHAIKATAGGGKTEAGLRALAPVARDRRVHFCVPTHELADEAAERYAQPIDEAAATYSRFATEPARIHRGRKRPEPAADGAPMCFDDVRERADQFDEAGLDVYERVCKTCSHLGECGWSRQKADKGPGVIFMPAEYAFEPTAKRADILVLDEGFHKPSLSEHKVNLDEPLPGIFPQPHKSIIEQTRARRDLVDARKMLRQAADASPEGTVTRKALREAGITAEIARFA